MGILDEILRNKLSELPTLRGRALPPPPSDRPPFDLRRGPGAPLRLICEIKKRSPSAGALSTALSVGERARIYEKAGATALSVLCDEHFFDGAYEDLLEARQQCTLPLLCKEFILDECQLDAAVSYGASAVLLIVRCLKEAELVRLLKACHARSLSPLVEVHTEEETRVALGSGAELIGVNARDLDTLQMDSVRATEILARLPPSVIRVHLSGIKGPQDITKLAQSSVDAGLVGELLMREDAPEATLRALVSASSE